MLYSTDMKNFAHQFNIYDVEFPDNMLEIPSCYCFGCRNMFNVTLNNTLMKIHDQAFAYCKKLKYI